jgi:S1-C subfamily serine protease
MEDTLLIDAAERFAKGEMSKEEVIYFEDLRKNNPELDQAVVEQLFFLNQLDNYSQTKNFKSVLAEVENKLHAEKFISRNSTQKEGKLIQLWHRYKKDIAVAAAIAGLVSIFMATLVSKVNNKNDNIIQLNAVEDKVNKIERKVNQIQADVQPDALSKAPKQQKIDFDARIRATGFMIDATNNYIVTNAHVIKASSNNLIVENVDGEQYYAKSVYVNNEHDLAIIKITDTNFKRLPMVPYNIRKTGAELGEQIFLMGYPKQEIVYGEGYVSAKNGYQMDTTYCQISTAANEGNSGSPVISKNGDLIGILTSTEKNANGVVYVIKSANIYRALIEVKKQKEDEKIKITSLPSLKGLDRVSQTKKIENYVFKIKGN